MNWTHYARACWPKEPTPLELAARELIEAQRSKLAAESAQEYAAASVAYNQARISRLTKFINQATKEQENGKS